MEIAKDYDLEKHVLSKVELRPLEDAPSGDELNKSFRPSKLSSKLPGSNQTSKKEFNTI